MRHEIFRHVDVQYAHGFSLWAVPARDGKIYRRPRNLAHAFRNHDYHAVNAQSNQESAA
jgi:hypothetical protein